MNSHGRRWGSDDHLGKEINRSGDGFTAKPARMETDVIAVKSGLTRLINLGEDVGLNKVQISLLRWHGAKSTFTSLMQHLELDPRVIRLSGDWSSKQDAMPDVYLREAQLLCLKGQEKCLYHLRQGGDFGGLVSEGLAGEGPPGLGKKKKGEKVDSDPSKAQAFEGVHASTLEESFLDGAFDQSGKVLFEQVDKDKEFEPDMNEIDKFLESPGDGEDAFVVYNFEKPVEPSAEAGGSSGDGRLEEKDLEISLPLDEGDETQDEGLTGSFVIAASGLSSSKLHLPAIDKDPSQKLLQVAVPACGLRGTFTYLEAKEAIDEKTEACVRCFGKRGTSCTRLCSFMLGESKRCARRCTADCSSTGVHLCHVHD